MLKIFILLISLLAFFGCKEKGNEQTEVMKEVKMYVNALKTNQYYNEYSGFPAFTDKHIDELLEYRNKKDIITSFPRNPISSFYQEKCELGVCILWTIEYIRINSINSRIPFSKSNIKIVVFRRVYAYFL